MKGSRARGWPSEVRARVPAMHAMRSQAPTHTRASRVPAFEIVRWMKTARWVAIAAVVAALSNAAQTTSALSRSLAAPLLMAYASAEAVMPWSHAPWGRPAPMASASSDVKRSPDQRLDRKSLHTFCSFDRKSLYVFCSFDRKSLYTFCSAAPDLAHFDRKSLHVFCEYR